MVRIRKRSLAAAANSSAKQELHESSNGELHLYAGPKSNHSFLQDPSTTLLSSPSIIIEDHLMLTGSGKGFTHDPRPAHKQIPAKGGAVKSSTVASTCGSRQARKNDKSLIAMKGGGNYVQDYEVKHMHMQDGDGKAKSMDIKTSMVATGLVETISTVYPERGDEAETRKKEQHGESITFSDPAIADAIDLYPRKVLPLQLILMSSESHVTAARVPAHNVSNNNINDNDKITQYLTSSGSTVQSAPSTPLKVPRERDAAEEKKASPTARKSRAVLFASAAGGSSKNDVDSEFAGVRNHDHEDMKLRRSETDANRCSQNTSSTHKSLERLVSSWQGHRRPRSFSHAAAGCRPSVSAEIQKSSLLLEQGNQLIVNPTPHTSSDSAASSAVILGNGKLKQQQNSSGVTILNTATNVKKKDHESSSPSAPAPCPQLPNTAKWKVGSNNRKRAAAPTDGHDLEMTVNVVPVNHVASPSSSAHDHDFMRCRRKDGRRWRCKERVIKPGAPFCHYHTLKMREKHSTRVVIRVSKQPQDEGPEMTNDTEVISKSGRKRASKRRRIRSSPYNNANMEDRYGAGMQGCNQEDEEEEEEEEDVAAINKLGKQQGKVLQEAGSSTAVKRRWRKKCKPCIRRLHDIQDRARPAATNDLDFRSSFWEDTMIAANYMQDSARPAIRVSCPLPVCLLNTDPHEWRSD